MQAYQYLLFDLDGTLTYSHPGIFACLRYALSALGRPEPSPDKLRLCIGPPLEYSFSVIFGLSEKETESALKKYRERYSTAGLFENEAIPGAAETLKKLKEAGYVCAIATSKPKVFSRRIADKFGFTPFLAALEGSGTDGSLPTKADVIAAALRSLDAEEKKDACLMIGDRFHDAEGAEICGIDFAGFTGGYASPGELEACGAVFLFSDYGQLCSRLGLRNEKLSKKSPRKLSEIVKMKKNP